MQRSFRSSFWQLQHEAILLEARVAAKVGRAAEMGLT